MNCIITGASSGIGRCIAIELSKSVKHIYITGRNISKLEEVHDIIIKNNCECTIVPLNLTDENVIENFAREVFKKDKFIDFLILSSGSIEMLSPIESIDLEKFKNILNINFLSNFRIIKSFHKLLINSKNPNLAVISSVKNDLKLEYWGIYQPIMTALNELVLTYALETKNSNLKVNLFCPDAVNTKLREKIMPGEDKKNIKTPEQVAFEVVSYILQNEKSGKIINI